MDNSTENVQPEINEINTAKPTPKKKKLMKKIMHLLIIFILIVGSGTIGYYLRDQTAKTDNNKNETTINSLNNENGSLKKQLTESEAANSDESDTTIVPSTNCTPTANSSVSSSTIENVQASITTGNTAALEGYMASSVCFALAASDGIGNMTAANAVSTLTGYMPDNDTWTFSPTVSELNSYKSGQYSKFFVDGAIIAKSSSGKMFVISFDAQGKINVILRSSTQEELKS